MTKENFMEREQFILEDAQNRHDTIKAFFDEAPAIYQNESYNIDYLIIFRNETKGIAAFHNGCLQCLNSISVNKKGVLRLSDYSIGGNLINVSEEQIKEYNEKCMFDGGKIKYVLGRDGSVASY